MQRPAVLLVALVGTLGVLSGCVAAPIPHPEYRIQTSRRPITTNDTLAMRPGTTTRGDVLCVLGEPDYWWDNERVLAYQWTTSNLGIAWAAGGGYQGAAGFIDIPIHHFLLISFDAQHRVKQVEFHEPPVGWLGPEF